MSAAVDHVVHGFTQLKPSERDEALRKMAEFQKADPTGQKVLIDNS